MAALTLRVVVGERGKDQDQAVVTGQLGPSPKWHLFPVGVMCWQCTDKEQGRGCGGGWVLFGVLSGSGPEEGAGMRRPGWAAAACGPGSRSH